MSCGMLQTPAVHCDFSTFVTFGTVLGQSELELPFVPDEVTSHGGERLGVLHPTAMKTRR
jgi:hypothetical protein